MMKLLLLLTFSVLVSGYHRSLKVFDPDLAQLITCDDEFSSTTEDKPKRDLPGDYPQGRDACYHFCVKEDGDNAYFRLSGTDTDTSDDRTMRMKVRLYTIWGDPEDPEYQHEADCTKKSKDSEELCDGEDFEDLQEGANWMVCVESKPGYYSEFTLEYEKHSDGCHLCENCVHWENEFRVVEPSFMNSNDVIMYSEYNSHYSPEKHEDCCTICQERISNGDKCLGWEWVPQRMMCLIYKVEIYKVGSKYVNWVVVGVPA